MSPHERPLTIYLSSTPEDLQKHCSAARQKLLREGYAPIGMSEDDTWGGGGAARSLRHRLEQVRTCDVFVGIVAYSYGDGPAPEETADLERLPGTVPGETSFTEYEYRQALAAKKRILMFLHDEESKWPIQHTDFYTNKGNKDRLRAWREEIRREHRFPRFTGRKDLADKVLAAIAPGLATEPRSPLADRNAPLARNNIPAPTYARLVGRQAQLKKIQEALSKSAPLIYLEGNDGIGKTSVSHAAGNAYLKQPTGELPSRYVAWVDASAEAGRSLTLDDVLNLTARVANYQSLAQVSMTTRDKQKTIRDVVQERQFLFIVDDFDRLENEELRQWLLATTLPSRALLVVRKAPPHGALAECIALDKLSEPEAIEYIKAQAQSLKIGEQTKQAAWPEAARQLASYTKGNPRIIELEMGRLAELLKAGRELPAAMQQVMQHDDHPEEEQSTRKIEELHRKAWEDLSWEARTVLRSIPLFSGTALIAREALLATCGLKKLDFTAAQQQLWARRLLKLDMDSGASYYTVDPDTRSFAQDELRKEPEFEIAARKRWSAFYLEFVTRRVVRVEPEVLYWRSLVSSAMEPLDAEWPALVDVLHWADQHRQDRLLLTLVLLLTHYMDSRFRNKERILFATMGVQAAKRLRLPYEEALLRIDALGWTYFEEDCPHKAYEEIALGLALVKPLMAASQDAWELRQLGLAWLARVKMDIALADKSLLEAPILRKEAVHLIEKALCANCSPWVRYRIFKAAGDIAFKAEILLRQAGQDQDALAFYLQAETEVAKYGGEGNSYQIAPRVGLAYLRKNELEKAKNYFNGLCQDPHMPLIGQLYGKYGMALIERELGQKAQADQEIATLKEDLKRHTSSNQLLKLVMTFDKAPAVPVPETTAQAS